MDKNFIKYFGMAASIIGAIATIVSSYCDKRELEAEIDEKMDKKIQKAFAEKAESEIES